MNFSASEKTEAVMIVPMDNGRSKTFWKSKSPASTNSHELHSCTGIKNHQQKYQGMDEYY